MEVQEELPDLNDDADVLPDPIMPHLMYTGDAMEEAYPSLEAVDGPGLEDLTRLEDDGLHRLGMHEVQHIISEMRDFGRTRKQHLAGYNGGTGQRDSQNSSASGRARLQGASRKIQ